MEEKLLELFKLADELNKKQERVYAKIEYTGDNERRLELSIINKKNYSYVEKCSIMLINNSISRIDVIIKIFNEYIGGASNE